MTITEARKLAKDKFLRFFPNGFADDQYRSWERDYKWNSHLRWEKVLSKHQFEKLLDAKHYHEITGQILSIEGKTNLLFSFEKMAIRDALKSIMASKQFSESLYNFLYGKGTKSARFKQFSQTISMLPRRQTRVLTWPIITVFGFIAKPKQYLFLKPKVTKKAAEVYQFDFDYSSQPNWKTYQSLVDFSKQIKSDLSDLKPKDNIDLQSFIWVLGSEEYN